MSKEILKKAVELAGGQVHLARGIQEKIPGSKIGQVHVWGWLNSVKMEVPPAEAVIAIAETVGWQITPHELRPDVYPNPLDGMSPAHQLKYLQQLARKQADESDDCGRRVVEVRRSDEDRRSPESEKEAA